jgi:hypothetical protein
MKRPQQSPALKNRNITASSSINHCTHRKYHTCSTNAETTQLSVHLLTTLSVAHTLKQVSKRTNKKRRQVSESDAIEHEQLGLKNPKMVPNMSDDSDQKETENAMYNAIKNDEDQEY